jgi:hypothetical protein
MPELTEKALTAWYSKLPLDVQQVIAEGDEPDPAEAADLSVILAGLEPALVPALLCARAAQVKGLGRIGRLRLLAWLVAEDGRAFLALFRERPVDESGEGGSDGGSDILRALIAEDLQALARIMVGPRIARLTVDDQSMDFAVAAGTNLESELIFRQGGI